MVVHEDRGDKEFPEDSWRKMDMELYDRLKAYGASDFYPWHMPGHKRRLVEFENPFSMDITEIDGFDDLHHPEGILKEAMERAAEIYGSEKTYFLVNGSSCGILTAISAAVRPDGKLLMARNCHKSAYYGAFLQQAEVTYLYPQLEKDGFYGAVKAEAVEDALKADPEICAVIIVSPGYEGIVSDIEAIAQIAHTYGCALIVDEAHGAHLSFADKAFDTGKQDSDGTEDPESELPVFPISALEKGADVVIQSLHKTLPSLTQTAVLHLRKGSSAYVASESIEFYLRVYQSSSPSYILMASIDHCIGLMASNQGKQLMAEYAANLSLIRSQLGKQLQILQLYEPETKQEQTSETEGKQQKYRKSCFYDPSKFVIVVPENEWVVLDCELAEKPYREEEKGEKRKKEKRSRQIDGSWLADILRSRYHLEPEMNTERYVILMSSPADTKEGFLRMKNALLEIDRMLAAESSPHNQRVPQHIWVKLPQKAPENKMKSAHARAAASQWIPLFQAAGKICHDFIYIYPPGIPLLVPGEQISKTELEIIEHYQNHGLEVHGIRENKTVCVVEL